MENFDQLTDAMIIRYARRDGSEVWAVAKERKDYRFDLLGRITDDAAENPAGNSTLLIAQYARNYVLAQRWFDAAQVMIDAVHSLDAAWSSMEPDQVFTVCSAIVAAAKATNAAQVAYEDYSGDSAE